MMLSVLHLRSRGKIGVPCLKMNLVHVFLALLSKSFPGAPHGLRTQRVAANIHNPVLSFTNFLIEKLYN